MITYPLLGFDFDYYDDLLGEIRAIRTRFPADILIVGGDFNVDLLSPRDANERLVCECCRVYDV
jgi:hypothetical protein